MKISNTTLISKFLSEFDNTRTIGLFATLNSTNDKTGDMIQLAFIDITDADQKPVTLVKNNCDTGTCGRCPFKGGNGCYVNTGQGPNSIFRAYQAGNIDIMDFQYLHKISKRKNIRIGSYGDVMSMPIELRDMMFNAISTTYYTGYSHSFDFTTDRTIMRSVETIEQAEEQWSNGLRTARIIADKSELTDNEIVCPALTNDDIQCVDCLLCGNKYANNNKVKSICFIAHGSRSKKAIETINAINAE